MRLSLFIAAAALCASSVTALADPVTYTLTGTFTGTIGALSFTDDPGTITQTTDTSDTVDNGGGFYTNTGGVIPPSITLDGIGTALFLSSSFGAEGSSNTAGFYDIDTSFGASTYDPCLGQTDCVNNYDPDAADYALSAPFSDSNGTLQIALPFLATDYPTELTSLGVLQLTGDDGTPATFTASSPAAVAPEPSSFLLLGTGLLTALAIVKRRYV